MTKRFFLKELVNSQVFYADGTAIPFIHGADDIGYLDLPSDSPRVAEIEKLIGKRQGGIFEVDEAKFNGEKKKQPWTRLNDARRGPRLFEPAKDPFGKPQVSPPQTPAQANARLAAGPVGAPPVVGQNPAPAAVAPVTPNAKDFKPKRGRVGKQP